MSSQENASNEKPVASIDILNDSDDDDELVNINLKSNSIEITYFQLCQYSKLIREDYTIKEMRENFSTKLQGYIDENGIPENSVISFFKLIQKQNIEISGSNFLNLGKISAFFKSTQIKKFLQKFLKQNFNNVSFIIDLILENKSNEAKNIINIDDLSVNLEDFLKNQINECLQNENFGKISIQVISRIIESSEKLSSDNLYDFIMKNIQDRHNLFQFIEIENLSDEKFDDLYNNFINEKENKKYYQYFQCTLKYLKKLRDENKKQKEQINALTSENEKLNEACKKNRYMPNLTHTYCQILYRFLKKVDEWPNFFTACLYGRFDIIKECINLTRPNSFFGLVFILILNDILSLIFFYSISK